MNERKPLPNRVPSEASQPKAAGQQNRRLSPQSMTGARQSAILVRTRGHLASPTPQPQSAPKVMQGKMSGSPAATHSLAVARSASGVVQANVVGGNQALQARLNAWHTSAVRGQQPNAARSSSAGKLKAKDGTAAIQRKTSPGVEAFRVPLRPKSGGQPIPDEVRAKMETAFGMNFSDVRVHIGQEASSLGAIAYTWGTNIHFAPGQYNPHTLQGQKLLGHELWHVVQQKNGRVHNPFGGGVAVVQDHALEAEADRMGIKAALTQIARRSEK
jgi:hypothetical protein